MNADTAALPSPAATALSTSVVDVDAVPIGGTLPQQWSRSASRQVLIGAGAIVVAALLMGAWLGLAPLSGSIVTMGQVKVDTNRKTVQHRDGGIVRDILVREGDRVAAGQTLIVLDDSRVDASFMLAGSQNDAQRIRLARLSAERDVAATWSVPPDLRKRIQEPRLAEIVARETALFNSRRSAYESQTRAIRMQTEEVAREVAALQRGGESIALALGQMQEEVSVNETLLEQQYVNKTRVLGLKRALAEYQIKQSENAAELSQARQRAADLNLRLNNLREAYVQEASTELRDMNGKLIESEEQLRTARDLSDRKVIVAPVAGRVVDLKVTTPGGTIGPRDPLMDIVPDGNPLLVEARVPVDAIGELHTGLIADVRLTAYKQREFPLIDGKVVYVSADALLDRQTGVPYFVVHIELDREAMKRAGESLLQPGMSAEVFVRTRERTAFGYLMEPFVNATRRSFRDY